MPEISCVLEFIYMCCISLYIWGASVFILLCCTHFLSRGCFQKIFVRCLFSLYARDSFLIYYGIKKKRITRRVPLVEQEQLTLPEHLISCYIMAIELTGKVQTLILFRLTLSDVNTGSV